MVDQIAERLDRLIANAGGLVGAPPSPGGDPIAARFDILEEVLGNQGRDRWDVLRTARTSIDASYLAYSGSRDILSVPSVSEVAPTSVYQGTHYFIDGVNGNNANNGTSPATPWKDIWKINGGGANATFWVAADAFYENAETWANFKTGALFPANNLNSTGTAASPTTIRPWYPRGASQAKPRISWHALMQSADWTQEAAISGGKVWSAAWAKAGNAYFNTVVYLGTTRTPGVAWLQQNTSGVPTLLNAAGQYAVDTTKVYVYVPDGTNPNSYYGEVRIGGGQGRGIFSFFSGNTQYYRILGMQFENCTPAYILTTGSTNQVHMFEMANCTLKNCMPWDIKNSCTFSGGVELSVNIHDNEVIGSCGMQFKLNFNGGDAGNKTSWALYRNRLNIGNLSFGAGGALFYNQAVGGVSHHAWGNYVFGAINSPAGEQIDGCGIYCDVQSSKAVIFGNIFEQCGKGFQFNSMSAGVAVSNLFVDCAAIGSVTNTTGDFKTPSAIVAHNTWLWTGRIALSSIRAGSNIGGTGVGSWVSQPVLNVTNSQANTTSNTTYNFTNFSLVNNVAVNASDTAMTRSVYGVIPDWTTTLTVAGNAAAGMGVSVQNTKSLADLSAATGYIVLSGNNISAKSWFADFANGKFWPSSNSPLIGGGTPLSIIYNDIGGRSFASLPSIGSYESMA